MWLMMILMPIMIGAVMLVNSKRPFQKYQYNRSRTSTSPRKATTTSARSAKTTTTAKTTAFDKANDRFNNDNNNNEGDDYLSDKNQVNELDDFNAVGDVETTDSTFAFENPVSTISRRVRVLKYRRPIGSTNSSTNLVKSSNSDFNTTTRITNITNTSTLTNSLDSYKSVSNFEKTNSEYPTKNLEIGQTQTETPSTSATLVVTTVTPNTTVATPTSATSLPRKRFRKIIRRVLRPANRSKINDEDVEDNDKLLKIETEKTTLGSVGDDADENDDNDDNDDGANEHDVPNRLTNLQSTTVKSINKSTLGEHDDDDDVNHKPINRQIITNDEGSVELFRTESTTGLRRSNNTPYGFRRSKLNQASYKNQNEDSDSNKVNTKQIINTIARGKTRFSRPSSFNKLPGFPNGSGSPIEQTNLASRRPLFGSRNRLTKFNQRNTLSTTTEAIKKVEEEEEDYDDDDEDEEKEEGRPEIPNESKTDSDVSENHTSQLLPVAVTTEGMKDSDVLGIGSDKTSNESAVESATPEMYPEVSTTEMIDDDELDEYETTVEDILELTTEQIGEEINTGRDNDNSSKDNNTFVDNQLREIDEKSTEDPKGENAVANLDEGSEQPAEKEKVLLKINPRFKNRSKLFSSKADNKVGKEENASLDHQRIRNKVRLSQIASGAQDEGVLNSRLKKLLLEKSTTKTTTTTVTTESEMIDQTDEAEVATMTYSDLEGHTTDILNESSSELPVVTQALNVTNNETKVFGDDSKDVFESTLMIRESSSLKPADTQSSSATNNETNLIKDENKDVLTKEISLISNKDNEVFATTPDYSSNDSSLATSLATSSTTSSSSPTPAITETTIIHSNELKTNNEIETATENITAAISTHDGGDDLSTTTLRTPSRRRFTPSSKLNKATIVGETQTVHDVAETTNSPINLHPTFRRKLIARRPFGATTKTPFFTKTSRFTKPSKYKNDLASRKLNTLRSKLNSNPSSSKGFLDLDERKTRFRDRHNFRPKSDPKTREEEEEDEAGVENLDDDYDDNDYYTDNEEEDNGERRETIKELPSFPTINSLNGQTFLNSPNERDHENVNNNDNDDNEDGDDDNEEEIDDDDVDDVDEEEDGEEDDDFEEDDLENSGKQDDQKVTNGSITPLDRENPTTDSSPKILIPYKAKDNRTPPGARPAIKPSGHTVNAPFNPFNGRQSVPTSKRPRVVNRPSGVALPTLPTIQPLAFELEPTTLLTLTKPAPFIPTNTPTYERKYSGPSSTELNSAEINIENSLENLDIEALNARNKKLFELNSKKHTTTKPKSSSTSFFNQSVLNGNEDELREEQGKEEGQDVEEGNGHEQVEEEEQQVHQGFDLKQSIQNERAFGQEDLSKTGASTTTASSSTTTTTTTLTTETETTTPTITTETPITTANNHTNTVLTEQISNEISSQESSRSIDESRRVSTTTSSPPTTFLLHVFTLTDGDNQTRPPPIENPNIISSLSSPIDRLEPEHKIIEINRIVEITSKEEKLRHKSKDKFLKLGLTPVGSTNLRVEKLPHLEHLGEISVVKYVHEVNGDDIRIDSHSSVADYTPSTEPSFIEAAVSPVRNIIPDDSGFEYMHQLNSAASNHPYTILTGQRQGKSVLPEVILEAFETSTISLEGLFESAREGKDVKSLDINTVDQAGREGRQERDSPTLEVQESPKHPESNTIGLSFNKNDLKVTQKSAPEHSLSVRDSLNTTSLANAKPTNIAAVLFPAYVRPIVPLLRPESNESSPLVISISNLDKVVLSKVPKKVVDLKATESLESAVDSNVESSNRHLVILKPPTNNNPVKLEDYIRTNGGNTSQTIGSVGDISFSSGDSHTFNNNSNNKQNYDDNINHVRHNSYGVSDGSSNSGISRISEEVSVSSETHVVTHKKKSHKHKTNNSHFIENRLKFDDANNDASEVERTDAIIDTAIGVVDDKSVEANGRSDYESGYA